MEKTNTITGEILTLKSNGLNNKEIAEKLNKSTHYIRNVIYRATHKTLIPVITENAIEQQPEPILRGHLEIRVKEENDGEVYLYVKSSKEFEEYLKANKEIRPTQNLFNRNENGNFYYMPLENDLNNLDGINREIIINGKINRAILRLVGISDGLKFKINGLYSSATDR